MLANGAERNLKEKVAEMSVEKGEVYGLVQRVFRSIYTKVAFVASVIGTLALATVLRGDHMTILAHTKRWMEHQREEAIKNGTLGADDFVDDPLNAMLATYNLQYVHWFVLAAALFPLISFSMAAGGLMWYYNFKQRNEAKEWKCQPKRFNTRRQLVEGLLISYMNMTIGGLASGIISCFIINGGNTTLYYDVSERGILYLILSAVGMFILLEGMAYYLHRLYHIPFLYRTIHKWHHWYQFPAAVHAIVFHPIEFVTFQGLLAMQPFIFPLHVGVFIGLLMWQYYYGVIDHSGIAFESIWPWQPTVLYHDYHHKCFHVNYGFNLYLFDWLHDTNYRGDRVYTEDNFSGGKPIERKKAT